MIIKPYIWIAVCLLLAQIGFYEELYAWYAVGGFWFGQFFQENKLEDEGEKIDE